MGHDGGMMDMMDMMGGMMAGWMLLWALVGLALLVLAVLAALWLARRLSPGRPDEAVGAEELLRRRYAAGEIDREEYLRMQRDLAGS